MDISVALVRAYLQLNGYFTITEYPVVRKLRDASYRTLTDVDVAGLHLPGGERDFDLDPAPYLRVLLSDVVAYVDRYIEENWELVRTSGSRDPIFGVMLLLAKARRGVKPAPSR